MEAATRRSLRILLAVHHFPPTRVAGAEQFSYRVARGLLQRGHSVQVACVESVDDTTIEGKLRWSDEVFEDIPVRRFCFDLRSSPDSQVWAFDNPLLEGHLTKWISTDRPDLVHLVSGYLMGVAPLRAAQLFSIPTVVTLTDFWFLCPTINLLRGDGELCRGPSPLECARCLFDQKRRYRIIDRRWPGLMRSFWRIAGSRPVIGRGFGMPGRLDLLARRREILADSLNSADVIAPVTRFLADIYASNGTDASRFEIAPYGVNADAVPPVRRGQEEIRFGYLGQIAPIKGVDVLVRAFKRLDRSLRRSSLSIYGGMSSFATYGDHLRRMARPVEDIRFFGPYENTQVMKILADLDVLVVPSIWYENSPTVVLEAFAAGRPVIGTNVGGISEIVKDGVSGLLFERGDADDLCRQMQRLLSTPDLLESLKRGIPPVLKPDEELDRYLGIYERAILSHSLGPNVP